MECSIEGVSKKIIDRVEDKFQGLLDILCAELAYIVMFYPKYAVSHEYDPPWDCSGMLINRNETFSSKDYGCVADFLEEYTGQSRASFESGQGLFHVRYEEHVEDIIRDFVFECYCEVLSEMDSGMLFELLINRGVDVSDEDSDDLIRASREFELFEEPLGYHYELLERIQIINFDWMILRGKEEAKEKQEAQLRLLKERNKRAEIEKGRADALWHKLQKLYKLQTGDQLLKIEMKDYKYFREFLGFNHVSREERMLLVQQLSHKFSNKVCLNLCR